MTATAASVPDAAASAARTVADRPSRQSSTTRARAPAGTGASGAAPSITRIGSHPAAASAATTPSSQARPPGATASAFGMP